MVERVIEGHKVAFYDSVEDLPIVQFHRYAKYSLVEGGVGDTIADIDRHISRIISFLDDKDKAYKELLNLRQCLFLVATEQDVHNKATLCLIKSIDGEDWTDFSDNGLERLYRMLCSARQREMDMLAIEVRKAIDDNLIVYFPSVFNDVSSKNYLDLMRKRAILQLGSIIKGEDNKKKIEDVTREIHSFNPPKGFSGQTSEEIKFDKQFEDMCLVMAKEFGGGIKRFTTMEFYTAFERLNRQQKEFEKIKNKKR